MKLERLPVSTRDPDESHFDAERAADCRRARLWFEATDKNSAETNLNH
jgi:hypothetical protein